MFAAAFAEFQSNQINHTYGVCNGGRMSRQALGCVHSKTTVAKGGHRDAVQGASDAVGYIPTRSEQHRNAPDALPSLRVEAKSGLCGVVGTRQGITLGFTLRLAAFRIAPQRDPPAYGEHTLGFKDACRAAPVPSPAPALLAPRRWTGIEAGPARPHAAEWPRPAS